MEVADPKVDEAEQPALGFNMDEVYVEANRQFLWQKHAMPNALFGEHEAVIEEDETGAKQVEASQQLSSMYTKLDTEIV
ncbi:hypothetical protein D1007_27022 [Hordeum vulgare]|nr:hypothetical protein D1007_27022 [Hordeum vulgare]